MLQRRNCVRLQLFGFYRRYQNCTEIMRKIKASGNKLEINVFNYSRVFCHIQIRQLITVKQLAPAISIGYWYLVLLVLICKSANLHMSILYHMAQMFCSRGYAL